jgi:hypothetical protein
MQLFTMRDGTGKFGAASTPRQSACVTKPQAMSSPITTPMIEFVGTVMPGCQIEFPDNGHRVDESAFFGKHFHHTAPRHPTRDERTISTLRGIIPVYL